MAKKPWRVLQVGDDTGRFTRQQIEDAVRVVRERNEAKRRNGGDPGAGKPNGSSPAGAAAFARSRDHATETRARSTNQRG